MIIKLCSSKAFVHEKLDYRRAPAMTVTGLLDSNFNAFICSLIIFIFLWQHSTQDTGFFPDPVRSKGSKVKTMPGYE